MLRTGKRHMGLIPLLCLFISLASPLYAQQRLDDDLENFPKLPQDSSRVEALCRISDAMIRDYPDSAMAFAGQAMAISRKINYMPGQSRARLLQTRAFIAKGDFENAEASLGICESEFGQAADADGLAECALAKAEMNLARHNWTLALAACHKADSLLQGDSTAWWATAHLRGRLFQELGSLDQAGQYFSEAIRLASVKGDVRGHGLGCESLGQVLLAQGRNDSAAIQFRDAFEAWKAAGDRNGQSSALIGEGTAAVRAGRPENGFQLLRKAYIIALEDGARQRAALALVRLGESEVKLGQPDSALKRCADAVNLLRQPKDLSLAVDARIGLVQALMIKGDYARGIRQGDTAIALADSFRLWKPLATVNLLISRAYQTTGDYRKALDHFQWASMAKDSLQRQRDRNQTTALQVRLTDEEEFSGRHKIEQANAVAEAAQSEAKRNSLLFWICLGALILGTVLGGWIVFRANGRARKLAQRVREQNDELDRTKEELARVSTRLQESNFDYESVIAERTETLQEAVESLISENEALEEFINHSANDLLGPIARLKGLVSVARNSGQIKDLIQAIDLIDAVSVYMDKVIRKLIASHEVKHGFKNAEQVNLEELILDIIPQLKQIPGVKYPDIRLDDRLKRPVYVDRNMMRVILENLLENACVFRKDVHNDSPKIDVLLQKEDEGILIRIHDEGIGIPNSIRDQIFDLFFRGNERSKGVGLGLHLVQRALRQIGGRVAVESRQGMFTEFTVRFREYEA